MASTSAGLHQLAPGDNILLYGDFGMVAIGIVHSVDEADQCNGEFIGQDRISVQIQSSLLPDYMLPYRSMGANTVGEAVNSFVLWDIAIVHHIPQKPLSRHQEQSVPIPRDSPLTDTEFPSTIPSPAEEGEASSRERQKNVRAENQLYFKLRKNWSNVEVTLLSMLESVPIVDGIIFLPFSFSCVDGVEVGERYARVLVSNVLNEVDFSIIARDLPNFVPEDPIIVRWPILHLRINSNGAILGHLYKAFEDADSRGEQVDEGDTSGKKKRAYHSVKRSKPNPEDCMRKVDKKDVLDERIFFYNEPF
ncbi:hypothetical protein R1sor_003621 [Riccia sorocarpa]|uniref:Uncharacterized protein n=1 Tax=Riccia sorocarpa TaxID=122646 RepID=A0ABD3H618_9MARC